MLQMWLFRLPSNKSIKTVLQSPADKTQRIHAGDEVVQVNKQTVVSQKSTLKKKKKLDALASEEKIDATLVSLR